MITWRPIAELPDELKDGREVLLWLGEFGASVCSWSDHVFAHDKSEQRGAWQDEQQPLGFIEPTHYAEITPPTGETEMPWPRSDWDFPVGTHFTVQDWPNPGINRFQVVDGVPPLKSRQP